MVRPTLSSSILSTAMLVSCETSSSERTNHELQMTPGDGAGIEALPRRHPLHKQKQKQSEHSRLSRRSKGRLTRLLETNEEANLTLQRDRDKQQRYGENTRWRRIAQSKPTCPDEWELRGPSVGYTAGDVISAPKSRGSNDGFVFSCKPWPMSGHCNQRGFEPMVDSATPGAYKMAWDMIGECSYSLETSPPSSYPSSDNPFVDTSIETQMKALCTFPCCTSDIQCELAGPNCYCERSFYVQSDSIGYCTCKAKLPQQFDAEHDLWTTNGASQLVGVIYDTPPTILESEGGNTFSEVQIDASIQSTAVTNSFHHLLSEDPSIFPSHRPSLSPTDESSLLPSESPVIDSVKSAFDIEQEHCQFPCCTTDDQCGGGGCYCDMKYPGSENGKGQCGCDQGPTPNQLLDSEEENYCMMTEERLAFDIVESMLLDPLGHVIIDNIEASSHECMKTFSQGHGMGRNPKNGDHLIPDSGIIMSSGSPDNFCWNDSDQMTKIWDFTIGDADLNQIVGGHTYDECVLEFDFKCNPDSSVASQQVSFNYVFGSEEYYEYVSSDFNDAFAFLLNGHNIAKLPSGETVSINTVNYETNSEYFLGNDIDAGGIEHPWIEADGLTVPLQATGTPDQSLEWQHIKLVVADVADRLLDSYVLIEANSFACIETTEGPSPIPSTEPSSTIEPPVAVNNETVKPTKSECMVFDTKPAEDLVEKVFKAPGGEVEFENITASAHDCFKYFYNGHQMGYHKETSEQLIFQDGIILSTGTPEEFCWNDSDQQTKRFETTGDGDLERVIEQNSGERVFTYDACVIEFDFRCAEGDIITTSEVSFEYIFGSEEYYEYVYSDFNDAFAFFLNGDNIAILPDGLTEVTINNVNHFSNAELFNGNDASEPTVGMQYIEIEADGFTNKLVAKGKPKEGWNNIKIVVADIADELLDSYVLLEAGSFTCVPKTASPSREPSQSPTYQVQDNPKDSDHTVMPSSAFETSRAPSRAPSSAPSISSGFSEPPSFSPSSPLNSPTSNPPSIIPTNTAIHSSLPSQSPSFSRMPSTPSLKPSERPSMLNHPSSSMPSVRQSVSRQPSMIPSMRFSSGGMPSRQPSSDPIKTQHPSALPSVSPSISASPSSLTSESPSVSIESTAEASETPSISGKPSREPSVGPTISSLPSYLPSSQDQSLSTQPSLSQIPSHMPSTSPLTRSRPSSLPILLKPTRLPTSDDAVSVVSTSPSFSPSVLPTTSEYPSMINSNHPQSYKPSLLDSLKPSPTHMEHSPTHMPIITMGPTNSDNFSPMPSSEPSLSRHHSMTPSQGPSSLLYQHSAEPTASQPPSTQYHMHPTSAAPSESNENSVPSKSPSSSTSTPPSIRQPSSSPTSSAHPSAIEPPGQSFSIYPSLKPSESLSATPTNELSHEPSASSTGHSSKPSKRQDVTYKPTTMIQSLSPSMLKEGSIWPSTTPSIAAHVPSAMPSFQSNEIPPMTNILPPSQSPSISTRPSELADASLPPSAESSLSRPTPLPSDASSSKSTSPSSEQGMDSVPSLEPSSSPPINSKPHPMTSGKPSVISQPSSLPPTLQYVSRAPSNIPSHAPSVVSTNPTSLHSDNPSSPAPSSSQSFTAKPTLYNSVAPSVLNSSSTRPSVKAISTSTPTHCDVLRDRLFDPCTEANEVGWAGIRVTITLGDGVAYSQTYTDPNGYYEFRCLPEGRYRVIVHGPECPEPSSRPSISQGPSNQPSNAPSLSSNPSRIPSETPSVSSMPSDKPTATTSLLPSKQISLRPSMSGTPSVSPTENCNNVLQDRVLNPCVNDDNVGWVGILVTITLGNGIAYSETYTDSNGYYEFKCLPEGRYRVIIHGRECPQPSAQPSNSIVPSWSPTISDHEVASCDDGSILRNVRVQLTLGGSVLEETFTDKNGHYKFETDFNSRMKITIDESQCP